MQLASLIIQGENMNKKLFALMMVPIIVVMGVTFAFSAWAGSSNAFFGQTVATVGYSETLSFSGTNANLNPLTISDGHSSESVSMNTLDHTISASSGSATSSLNVYANVTYLVPGQYINFTVVIKNTGNVILNASMVTVTGGNTFNGLGQQVSGPQTTMSFLQPSITYSFLENVVQNGLSVPNGDGTIYLENATSNKFNSTISYTWCNTYL